MAETTKGPPGVGRFRPDPERLVPAPADARFELVSEFQPRGDQPAAIGELAAALERGDKHQVLLGVTGSGKTFTIASAIARINRPALVLAHNKTLAAQLYQEFRGFFPKNAVEYFVSYYDYYQPEAYVPQSDTYIDKEAIINDEIDRLRLSATRSLFERRDVIIVASVSCIYGLGSPEAYYGMLLFVRQGERLDRRELLAKLVEARYDRNDYELRRGTFRVRGRRGGARAGLRGDGHPHRAVRRRGGDDRLLRPPHREDARPPGPGRHLPDQPLRDARGRAWRTRSRASKPS